MLLLCKFNRYFRTSSTYHPEMRPARPADSVHVAPPRPLQPVLLQILSPSSSALAATLPVKVRQPEHVDLAVASLVGAEQQDAVTLHHVDLFHADRLVEDEAVG